MNPREAQADDPAWLKAAFGDLGIKEVPGKAAHPRVVEMFADARAPHVKDDETAWCSAAVCSWMVRAGQRPTYSLAARSWRQWGKPVSGVVPRGAVVVFRRGSGWQGHVAVALGDQGSNILVIGGNQQNSVSIIGYSRAALVDVRWPSSAANSNVVRAGAVSIASGLGSTVWDFAGRLFGGGGDGEDGGVLDTLRDALYDVSYTELGQKLLLLVTIASVGVMLVRYVKRQLRPLPEVPLPEGPSIEVEPAALATPDLIRGSGQRGRKTKPAPKRRRKRKAAE
ncbi:MAG: TIGR02594 family protein [Xanthobacteraceae bacterium]